MLIWQPDGAYVAEIDGLAVGTVTTCRLGPVAWIAMMLVDPGYRRRGVGRSLMVRALADLDAQGVRTVRLDATPSGRPLYESLGFIAETTFARFQGVLPPPAAGPDPAAVQSSQMRDEVIALDREVTGTDRARILKRLFADDPGGLRTVERCGTVAGFLMTRPGSKARQLGPCIGSPDAGRVLLLDAQRRFAGEFVFIDIPTSNARAVALAESWGLSVGRLLTRMGRGPRVVEDLERLWASAGPEKG